MKFRALFAGLVLCTVSAFAGAVDGKWTGSVSTPNGDVPVVFTFMADGATLNGTMAGMDGMDIKIADGKVDGNNISFNVTLDFGGMPFKLAYTGMLDGEQIKMKAAAEGMPMPLEFTVKKSS